MIHSLFNSSYNSINPTDKSTIITCFLFEIDSSETDISELINLICLVPPKKNHIEIL